MIDKLGFSGLCRGFCQALVIHQHVDERTFPNIRTADKRHLRKLRGRTTFNVAVADYKFCRFNEHVAKLINSVETRRNQFAGIFGLWGI